MRYFQGGVTYLTCFFTEDRTQKALFCRQLCLTLRCYFPDQDISGTDLCADADDSALVKVF